MLATLDTPGLRRELALRGMTLEELALAAGISRPTASHALAGRRLSYLTIRSIARALTVCPVLPGAEAIIGSQRESATSEPPLQVAGAGEPQLASAG